MLFPVIRVRDKGTKDDGVIVGSNSHHKLELDHNGNIKFVNVQCMDSTGIGGGYEFVAKKGYYDYEIEMVNFDRLLEIYKDQIKLSCEDERKIRDMINSHFEEQVRENKLDEDDGMQHTAGNFLK
jgi:hypothetical protein